METIYRGAMKGKCRRMIYAQSLVILVRQQIVNAEYCKILNVHFSFIGFIVGKVMVTNPLDQASVPRYELVYKDI